MLWRQTFHEANLQNWRINLCFCSMRCYKMRSVEIFILFFAFGRKEITMGWNNFWWRILIFIRWFSQNINCCYFLHTWWVEFDNELNWICLQLSFLIKCCLDTWKLIECGQNKFWEGFGWFLQMYLFSSTLSEN